MADSVVPIKAVLFRFFLHTRATANAININIVITLSKMLNIRFAI